MMPKAFKEVKQQVDIVGKGRVGHGGSSWKGFAVFSRRNLPLPAMSSHLCTPLDYLRAQLTMDTERNFANMDRTLNGGDGQALQHFMSNSPWSGPAVFEQIQAEIKATPALAQGSTLILDESADEKAGMHNVGASRQYNGRLGKVDVCRVDTCLTYANGGLWTMVDGELFLPEEWFGAAFAQTRQALGIPSDRTFETKIQLGLKMVKRVKAKG